MTTPAERPDTNEDFDYIAFALKRMWGERDEASAKFPSSIEAWAQYDRLCASIAEAEAQIAAKDAALKDAQDLYEQTRAELTAALRDAAEARDALRRLERMN